MYWEASVSETDQPDQQQARRYGWTACWKEKDGKHCRKPIGHKDACAFF